MYPFRTIIVATDLGPSSERAIDLGLALSRTHDASLILVHAYSLVMPMYPVRLVPAMESVREAASDAMNEVLTEVRRVQPKVRGIVRHGEVWSEVLAQAQESNADLIVTGTHGHHGIARLLQRSVAEKIVRSSPIPVLTVHGPRAARDPQLAGRQVAAE